VTNPYFVPDRPLAEAFLAAARRGVRVVVLVPGVIDHALVGEAGRQNFGELLRAGIEIYEYQPALLHSKTMVVDGVWATVGSTNLDHRSFALNDELNVAVYEGGFAATVERVSAADVAAAKRMTYEAWQARGPIARLYELITIPLRDLLSPGRLLKKAHLLRWRPRPHAQRTGSTPRVRRSGAASHLDLFAQPASFEQPARA